MNTKTKIVSDYLLDDATSLVEIPLSKRPFSIQEHIQLLPPLRLKGVDIYILDESSGMHTGSFKALDAKECIADCLDKGVNEICFTSGGNTGTALTAYANRFGIETHFFIPAHNTWKLDARYVSSLLSHIYAVRDAGRAKELCKMFSQETGIPQMPEVEHRTRGARKRGEFIGSLIHEGLNPDWFVQTVCGGFGPIGIYDYLSELQKLGQINKLLKFLGVQQSGNCALAKYLEPKVGRSRVAIDNVNGDLIEEIMYDRHPETYGTFTLMESVLQVSNGAVITVTKNEFNRLLHKTRNGDLILEYLDGNGVRLGQINTDRNGMEIVQKSGLIAMIGALKAITMGLITKGQTVLCSFSGGATRGAFQPLPESYPMYLNEPYEKILGAVIDDVNQRRGHE